MLLVVGVFLVSFFFFEISFQNRNNKIKNFICIDELSSSVQKFIEANTLTPSSEKSNYELRATSPVSTFSSSSTRSETKEHSLTDDRSNNNNSSMLRDIETLIGNMEQTQAKQNENMLKNIENMLGNLLAKQSRPQSSNSDFSANSYERIYVKSPIPSKGLDGGQQYDLTVENDVRNFMEKHIQEVNPDIVEQVSLCVLNGNCGKFVTINFGYQN